VSDLIQGPSISVSDLHLRLANISVSDLHLRLANILNDLKPKPDPVLRSDFLKTPGFEIVVNNVKECFETWKIFSKLKIKMAVVGVGNGHLAFHINRSNMNKQYMTNNFKKRIRKYVVYFFVDAYTRQLASMYSRANDDIFEYCKSKIAKVLDTEIDVFVNKIVAHVMENCSDTKFDNAIHNSCVREICGVVNKYISHVDLEKVMNEVIVKCTLEV
jgi:hypothetical protein